MTVRQRTHAGSAVAPEFTTHGAPAAVWLNGRRQAAEGAHLSGRDRGLTLADGAFETMRAHNLTVFRLDRHLERLRHALGALEIPAPTELRSGVLDAVQSVGGSDVSVRLTVTRGIGKGGVAPCVETGPTVLVAVAPLPVFPKTVYDVGLTAHVASGRRNEHAMTVGLKTLAYTEAVMALLEAQHAGADEALFLDTKGHCSEATSSNLFVWTGRTLLTPPASCGALPGITRQAVLEVATARGVPTAQRPFGLDHLLDAEEAFLTSSLRGLAPLVRVGGHTIGLGTPGALTHQLADAYTALVARECGRSVTPWPDRDRRDHCHHRR